MKRSIDLSPLGHGARGDCRLRSAPSPGQSAGAEQELLDWYRKIREPLKALYSIEDEVAFIAWELARWQDGLELIEQQAVILLVLTVLVQLRQGSTRIRLPRPGGTIDSPRTGEPALERDRADTGHDRTRARPGSRARRDTD